MATALSAGSLHAATLLYNDFGAGADTGPSFQQLWNGNGTVSANPATGYIETTGTNNATIGLNTSGTVDASGAAGFTITWVVSSFVGDLNNSPTSYVNFNGWFFGVTTNTGTGGGSLWNNTPEAVGIVLDGGTTHSDWQLAQLRAGVKTLSPLNGSQPTEVSIEDGFSISLTINDDNTWSATSAGLSNNIAIGGSLAGGTYATIAGSLVANTTIQGTGLNYTIDSVTIETIPEPSSLLMAFGGLGLLLLRRR